MIKAEVRGTGLKLFRRGKVRDVYDLGARLLIAASDRISAFDSILPTPIPGKGEILTKISAHWFERTRELCPNHMIVADREDMAAAVPVLPEGIGGCGLMLVKKARSIDVECVARGYLSGSAWKEYRESGRVAGLDLPTGLKEADRLPEPIFTPATKVEKGHDENISYERLAGLVGEPTAGELKRLTLSIYQYAAPALQAQGLILADTKLEFGFLDGKIILIDELLTPDSSRLWDAATYAPGRAPESFDKQYVRDYLEKISWNKQPPAPALPPEVVEETRRRYLEALRRITS